MLPDPKADEFQLCMHRKFKKHGPFLSWVAIKQGCKYEVWNLRSRFDEDLHNRANEIIQKSEAELSLFRRFQRLFGLF